MGRMIPLKSTYHTSSSQPTGVGTPLNFTRQTGFWCATAFLYSSGTHLESKLELDHRRIVPSVEQIDLSISAGMLSPGSKVRSTSRTTSCPIRSKASLIRSETSLSGAACLKLMKKDFPEVPTDGRVDSIFYGLGSNAGGPESDRVSVSPQFSSLSLRSLAWSLGSASSSQTVRANLRLASTPRKKRTHAMGTCV
jgi:hypothetical protein